VTKLLLHKPLSSESFVAYYKSKCNYFQIKESINSHLLSIRAESECCDTGESTESIPPNGKISATKSITLRQT